jgi:carbon storage regulator
MLVLSRRSGERIIIDGRITIVVVEVRGRHVRLGIEAPKDVSVRREELAADKKPVAA